MSDKKTIYISTSGEIPAEEVAKAQALYNTQRQEGESKQEMPINTDKAATGAIQLEDLREAISKADDKQSDSAPTG